MFSSRRCRPAHHCSTPDRLRYSVAIVFFRSRSRGADGRERAVRYVAYVSALAEEERAAAALRSVTQPTETEEPAPSTQPTETDEPAPSSLHRHQDGD